MSRDTKRKRIVAGIIVVLVLLILCLLLSGGNPLNDNDGYASDVAAAKELPSGSENHWQDRLSATGIPSDRSVYIASLASDQVTIDGSRLPCDEAVIRSDCLPYDFSLDAALSNEEDANAVSASLEDLLSMLDGLPPTAAGNSPFVVFYPVWWDKMLPDLRYPQGTPKVPGEIPDKTGSGGDRASEVDLPPTITASTVKSTLSEPVLPLLMLSGLLLLLARRRYRHSLFR